MPKQGNLRVGRRFRWAGLPCFDLDFGKNAHFELFPAFLSQQNHAAVGRNVGLLLNWGSYRHNLLCQLRHLWIVHLLRFTHTLFFQRLSEAFRDALQTGTRHAPTGGVAIRLRCFLKCPRLQPFSRRHPGRSFAPMIGAQLQFHVQGEKASALHNAGKRNRLFPICCRLPTRAAPRDSILQIPSFARIARTLALPLARLYLVHSLIAPTFFPSTHDDVFALPLQSPQNWLVDARHTSLPIVRTYAWLLP